MKPLPEGITLKKLERGAYGHTRYEVRRGDEILGRVEKHREASYRSENTGSRIRYGYRGESTTWWAYRHGCYHLRAITSYAHTRRDAVEALLRDLRENP